MLVKRRKILWPSIPALLIILTGIYFASARTRSDFSTASQPPATASIQPEQKNANDQDEASEEYLRRGRLRPQLHEIMGALGDRLEKPGKERLAFTGTIARAGSQQANPISVILEFPGRLRLEEMVNGQKQVTVSKGDKARKTGGTLNNRDEDLVEMLLCDSVEHFLLAQRDGDATRFLGPRFRLDDGTTANYSGPFFDLYETTELIKVRQDIRRQTKVYYFNSDTHLLERIRYRLANGLTEVEIRLKNWVEVQGQKLPGEIVRLENNTPVLTLTITSTGIGPRAADEIFGNP